MAYDWSGKQIRRHRILKAALMAALPLALLGILLLVRW